MEVSKQVSLPSLKTVELWHILEYLPARNVIGTQLVCSDFNTKVNDSEYIFWKILYRRDISPDIEAECLENLEAKNCKNELVKKNRVLPWDVFVNELKPLIIDEYRYEESVFERKYGGIKINWCGVIRDWDYSERELTLKMNPRIFDGKLPPEWPKTQPRSDCVRVKLPEWEGWNEKTFNSRFFQGDRVVFSGTIKKYKDYSHIVIVEDLTKFELYFNDTVCEMSETQYVDVLNSLNAVRAKNEEEIIDHKWYVPNSMNGENVVFEGVVEDNFNPKGEDLKYAKRIRFIKDFKLLLKIDRKPVKLENRVSVCWNEERLPFLRPGAKELVEKKLKIGDVVRVYAQVCGKRETLNLIDVELLSEPFFGCMYYLIRMAYSIGVFVLLYLMFVKYQHVIGITQFIDYFSFVFFEFCGNFRFLSVNFLKLGGWLFYILVFERLEGAKLDTKAIAVSIGIVIGCLLLVYYTNIFRFVSIGLGGVVLVFFAIVFGVSFYHASRVYVRYFRKENKYKKVDMRKVNKNIISQLKERNHKMNLAEFFDVVFYNGAAYPGPFKIFLETEYSSDGFNDKGGGHETKEGKNFDLLLEYGIRDSFVLTNLSLLAPFFYTCPIKHAVIIVSTEKIDVESISKRYNNCESCHAFENLFNDDKENYSFSGGCFVETNPYSLQFETRFEPPLVGRYVYLKFIRAHDEKDKNIDLKRLGLIGYWKEPRKKPECFDKIPKYFCVTREHIQNNDRSFYRRINGISCDLETLKFEKNSFTDIVVNGSVEELRFFIDNHHPSISRSIKEEITESVTNFAVKKLLGNAAAASRKMKLSLEFTPVSVRYESQSSSESQTLRNAVQFCCFRGDLDKIKVLLSKKWMLDTVGFYDLRIAAAFNQVQIVKVFLNKSNFNENELNDVFECSVGYGHQELIELFLKSEQIRVISKGVFNEAIRVGNKNLVEVLLALGEEKCRIGVHSGILLHCMKKEAVEIFPLLLMDARIDVNEDKGELIKYISEKVGKISKYHPKLRDMVKYFLADFRVDLRFIDVRALISICGALELWKDDIIPHRCNSLLEVVDIQFNKLLTSLTTSSWTPENNEKAIRYVNLMEHLLYFVFRLAWCEQLSDFLINYHGIIRHPREERKRVLEKFCENFFDIAGQEKSTFVNSIPKLFKEKIVFFNSFDVAFIEVVQKFFVEHVHNFYKSTFFSYVQENDVDATIGLFGKVFLKSRKELFIPKFAGILKKLNGRLVELSKRSKEWKSMKVI